MQILRLDRIAQGPGLRAGGAATLGVFDGVHLGHRVILDRVRATAALVGGPATVLTFAVHPVVIVKGLPPRLITSLPHRLRLFEKSGIDRCIVLPFDDQVRQLTATEFAHTVFVEMLDLRVLVLGPDAHVGRDREGDIGFLSRFCASHGIRLETVDDLRLDGYRVSSTRIRAAIADGDLPRACAMLGRDVSMFGTVVAGDRRGRALGFATANLDLHHEIRPPAGVYAVRARVADAWLDGVANIGIRPTFGPDGDLTVEVHLLDYAGDLYGSDLEVVLVARLRDELRFSGRDELVAQIQRDVAAARDALAAAPSPDGKNDSAVPG